MIVGLRSPSPLTKRQALRCKEGDNAWLQIRGEKQAKAVTVMKEQFVFTPAMGKTRAKHMSFRCDDAVNMNDMFTLPVYAYDKKWRLWGKQPSYNDLQKPWNAR